MTYQPEPKPPPYPPGYTPGPFAGAPYGQTLDPQAARQYQQDGEHLQLLSILYYVMGGFATLGACIPVLYFGIGLALIGGAAAQRGGSEEQAGLAAFGGLVLVIAIPFVLLMMIQVVCLFLTGRYLSQGRNHIFCFINACVLCLHAPFGTALGIFTIVVLSRESVKQRFEMNRYGYYQPPTTFPK